MALNKGTRRVFFLGLCWVFVGSGSSSTTPDLSTSPCWVFVGSGSSSTTPDLSTSPKFTASRLTPNAAARDSLTCFFVHGQNHCLQYRARTHICRLQQPQQTVPLVLGHRITGAASLRSSAGNNKQDGEQKDSKQGNTDSQLPETEQKKLMDSLQQRKKEVDNGAGRVYVVCTQIGFLNVHKDPDDPTRLDNVVSQVYEGDIVESVGPDEGDWVQHDLGGWSIRDYGGFTWLKPVDEAFTTE